jgi:hypothetical protein
MTMLFYESMLKHGSTLYSSVAQGMFVCFDKEVGWCVGIAMILVVGRE